MADRQAVVLIVDDDSEFIGDFRTLLPSKVTCHSASTPEDARRILAENDIDVVFLDIDLKADVDGLQLLREMKKESPELPVVMVSSDHSVQTVVRVMQSGASDYVGKSPDVSRLKLMIEKILAEGELQRRIGVLESEVSALVGKLIGESGSMQSVRMEMKRIAEVPSNVLITGESGTGKELVARGIHDLSDRRDLPFIAVNCAALSRELFESELFGHEKGSFTGAVSKRIGKFELVEAGTLFLDEITEIPVELQAKLLRVLQEREFERVGGNRLLPFDGRLLASSNRDTAAAIREGRLREDLYYRLNVTSIHLPPMAERKEDIPLLAKHFASIKSKEMKKPILGVSDQAISLLCEYD